MSSPCYESPSILTASKERKLRKRISTMDWRTADETFATHISLERWNRPLIHLASKFSF
ncbi:hypothetical protein BIFDEN_00202 [Bifidobacterium dentium ATCC 27678]|nr:hypothetical protein BIFDEN_00202 [Bifidobacterium dentium ATCC 27678]